MKQYVHRGSLTRIALLSACVLTTACAKEKAPSNLLVCNDHPGEVSGHWYGLEQPDYLWNYVPSAAMHVFSDGTTFTIDDGKESFATLSPGSLSWTEHTTQQRESGFGSHLLGAAHAASERFLFIQGGVDDGAQDRRASVTSADLLDLETGVWTRHEPPIEIEALRSDPQAFWTGEEFLIWGGGFASNEFQDRTGEYIIVPDGSFRHGALFNPVTSEWRLTPAAPDSVNPDKNRSDSTWTNRGLFVFGTSPASHVGLSVFAALFDGEEWSELSTVNAPVPQKWPRLVGADDGVYVLGGRALDEVERIRRIWYYSFSSSSWSEIERPEYVSPLRGAWMNQKLYVFGRCAADAVYDPQDNSWQLMPLLNIPSTGYPYVAGGRIMLDAVQDHYDVWNMTYIFSPETGEISAQAGAGGVGQ